MNTGSPWRALLRRFQRIALLWVSPHDVERTPGEHARHGIQVGAIYIAAESRGFERNGAAAAERIAYPSPKWIVDTLQGSRSYPARDAFDARPLKDWAGLSSEQVALLTMDAPQHRYKLRGVELDRRAFRLHWPQVCPQCLAERPWCEAFWDLRLAVACPVHRILLVDRCDRCGKALSWHRGAVMRCACGRDLTSLPTTAASQALCDVMQLLRHFVYRNDDVAPAPSSTAHLQHLGLQRFLRLIEILATRCRRHDQDQAAQTSEADRTAAVESAAQILADWPSGLHDFLDKEIAPAVAQTGALPRYSSFLGWVAGIDAAGDNTPDRDAFAFLEREVRQYLVGVLAQGGFRRCVTQGSCTPTRKCSPAGHGSRLLSEQGKPGPDHVATNPGVRPHVAWSGSASTLLKTPLDAAAQSVGMAVDTLAALRNVGAFGLALRGARRTHVSRDAVEQLKAMLQSWVHGRGPSGKDSAITVANVFHKYGALTRERAAFFVWLAESPLRVIGCTSATCEAEALQVDDARAREFFRTLRSRPALAA